MELLIGSRLRVCLCPHTGSMGAAQVSAQVSAHTHTHTHTDIL